MHRMTIIAAALLVAGVGAAEAQDAGKQVAVNGMQMYYEVSGQGEPLVVLHGAYMDIPTMGAIIPKLAGTHRVYAVEFQGHGRTSNIDRKITYQNRRTSSATRWVGRPDSSSRSGTRRR